jgi:hypothetical protein
MKEDECGSSGFEGENLDDDDGIFRLKEKMKENESGWKVQNNITLQPMPHDSKQDLTS